MALNATSEALIAAVAQVWPELPRLLGSDWDEFESAIVARLAALEDTDQDAAEAADDDSKRAANAALRTAQNELLRQFENHPVAANLLRGTYNVTLTQHRGPAATPAGSIPYHAFFAIPVFYATDRNPSGAPLWYTGDRMVSEDLSLGVVSVSIPLAGKLGTPRKRRSYQVVFRRQSRPDFNPQKWSEIMAVAPLPPADFVARARAFGQAAGGEAGANGNGQPLEPGAEHAHDVLIFIHGYNVSFTDAALRAAQLAYDFDFTGLIMLYSWPSSGTARAYLADRESADWSTEHFIHLLRTVLPQVGAHRIHAMAHSMGNRILVDALSRLSLDDGEQLGHVVFAAPDFDAQTFKQRATAFGKHAASYTLYVSDRDLALRLSASLSRSPRAGQGGAKTMIVANVETVDASQLPKKDVLGHSGFASDRTMLTDMKDIFLYGRQADQRSALQPRNDPDGNRYWAFPA